MLGHSDAGIPPDDCLPQWLWRCRGGDPLAVLIRLFILGRDVSVQQACRALAPTSLEPWERTGLLRRDGKRVRANVELAAQPGFFLASDPSFANTRPANDHVLGVTTSALTLNRSVLRRDVARSLDLGAGNGFLALHLAAHSEQVVGVDVNPRALAFARFNADLNGVANVEFRQGDRFAAVGDELFDLIVGNLPFVISPSREFLYRDGDAAGRTFFESVLEDAPHRLMEGGFGQFLAQWVDGSVPADVPGCDVQVIRFATEAPDEYASRWLLPGSVMGKSERNRQYRQWMKYYESRKIEAIHTGLWNLRRRRGSKNWELFTDRPLPTMTWGDRIAETFRSWGLWQGLSGREAMLEQRVALSPYTVLREESQWQPPQAKAQLMSSDGFSTPMEVSEIQRRFLAMVDGAKSLREIAPAVQVIAEEQWLEEVERLVLHGFLEVR